VWPYCQNRAPGVAKNFFGHGSENQFLDSPAPVCSDNDQVNFFLGDDGLELIPNEALPDDKFMI
jgi:hypothetical protein